MPRRQTRRLAANPPARDTGWTPKRLAHLRRKLLKKLTAFVGSLEFKLALEREQQKAPGLSTEGSACSADERRDDWRTSG
jgi:hypothetical protein